MSRKKLIKSEVASLFNTTKETLRYYEIKGLLKPEIDEKNYRLYDYKELQKLREIFLLRDLGISIDDMKTLGEGNIDKNDYISFLEKQSDVLKEKIFRFQNISSNIDQLIEVLRDGDENKSYLIRKESDRYYYVFDNIEEDLVKSVKQYYDNHRTFIEKSSYSERVLQIIYKYENLLNADFKDARMCMELSSLDEMVTNEKYKESIIKVERGMYLSIFYPYIEGGMDKITEFEKEICDYLRKNNLKIKSDHVIEKEHPELSIFLDGESTMFEIQLSIEKLK